jgi:hypothetical protein
MSEGHKPEKVVDEREAETEEGEEEVEVKSTDSEEDVWVKRLREQLADFQPLTPPSSPLATAKVGLRLRALIARTTVRDVVSFHARLIVLEAHDSVDHCLMVHPLPPSLFVFIYYSFSRCWVWSSLTRFLCVLLRPQTLQDNGITAVRTPLALGLYLPPPSPPTWF